MPIFNALRFFSPGVAQRYLFTSLCQAREQCLNLQYDYNHLRPNETLNFLILIEFRQAA